ncbi:MAG TPA: hypothetical protein VF534_20855 [Paraburkholderia sp.]
MKRHPGNSSRLIGTAGRVVIVCLSLGPLSAHAQRAPAGGYDRPPTGGGPSISIPLQWLFNRPEGASEARPTPPDPRPKPDAESLLKYGPQFPVSLSAGSFTVEGFMQGGWPFVIDVAPRPDSCTWLALSAGEKTYPSVMLDADGRAGRHVVKVPLPDEIGAKPQPGQYVVYSVQRACTSATGGDRQTARPFSPIAVYGIGGGPRAVGSVAVNNLQFGPSAPRFPQESASIGYNTIRDFGRGAEEILRFEATAPDQVSVQLVGATPHDPLQKGPHNGSWDGKDGGGARVPGVYRLQVRVWDTLNDQKSWAGAISPDSVHIVKQ